MTSESTTAVVLRAALTSLIFATLVMALVRTRDGAERLRQTAERRRESNQALEQMLEDVEGRAAELKGRLDAAVAAPEHRRALAQTHFRAAQTALAAGDFARFTKFRDPIAAAERRWEWQLLERQYQDAVQILEEPPGFVADLCWSPEERELAAVDDEGWLSVFELPTGKIDRRVAAHERSAATAVAWSPSLDMIATGGDDERVHLFSAGSLTRVRSLPTLEAGVTTLAFAGQEPWLIAGSDDQRVRVFDVEANTLIYEWHEHDDTVTALAVDEAAAVAFSASLDGTVVEYDLIAGTVLHRYQEHDDWVLDVALNATGERFASCSEDGAVQLWDRSRRTMLAQYTNRDGVPALALNAVGDTVGFSNYAGQVVLRAGAVETSVKLAGGEADAAICMTPDRGFSRFAMAATDSVVRIWHRQPRPLSQVIEIGNHSVETVAESADGHWWVAGTADGKIRVYDTASNECIQVIDAHSTSVTSAAISADGARVVSGGLDRTVRVFDRSTGQLLHEWHSLNDWVTRVTMSQDGQTVLGLANSAEFRRWDVNSGEELLQKPGPRTGAFCATTNTDGSLVAWASDGGIVRVWDGFSGEKVAGLRNSNLGLVTAIAIGETGDTVLCVSNYRTLLFWDVDKSAPEEPVSAREPVLCAAYAEAGKRVFLGTADAAVEVWNPQSQQLLLRQQGQLGAIACIAMGPRNQRLLTGGRSGRFEVWDPGPRIGQGGGSNQ